MSAEDAAFRMTEIVITKIDNKTWSNVTREEMYAVYEECLRVAKGRSAQSKSSREGRSPSLPKSR